MVAALLKDFKVPVPDWRWLVPVMSLTRAGTRAPPRARAAVRLTT
jgi:hypothetical protein